MLKSQAIQGKVVSADIRQCIEALEVDLLPHLMKEEQILFPYIINLESNPRQNYAPDFGTIANPIRVMGNGNCLVRNAIPSRCWTHSC